MKIKYIAICLVLLCCIIGTASAAEDISADVVSDSVDDAVVVDAVPEDIDDSVSTEPETISDDTNEDIIIEGTQTDENNEGSATEDSEPSRVSNTQVADWSALYNACISSTSQVVDLTGTEYTVGQQITFGNSITIRGTSNSYITGGSSSLTPFYNYDEDLTITFSNVKFKNMDVKNLLQLQGTNVFIDCSFENITTANDHNSIIWNEQGSMEITGCNFTNNHVNFGAVTNYDDVSSDIPEMSVENCKFINNTATSEPGAINNCGNLDVTSSEFINNTASLWAGAIHTHYNSNTVIHNSNFTNNVALWNGGALYTYCNLSIYNSNFNSNWCNKSAGGGAIGCSNWVSSYNILVEDCTFEDNFNNNSLQNETPATGCGGAISAMNDGVLDVHGSTFINNYAAFGQAIAAYSQGYVNITAGIPNVIIYNNTFRNHNRTTETDTVEISGNYTLENNTFINCHQENRNGSGNVYTNCTPRSQSEEDFMAFNENLKSKLGSVGSDILGIEGSSDFYYINVSSSESGSGLSWEEALAGADQIGVAMNCLNNDGTIYLSEGTFFIKVNNKFSFLGKNVTLIGQGAETIFDNYKFITTENTVTMNDVFTFINVSFINCDFTKSCKFINCNFINNITFTQYISTKKDQALERTGENCLRNFELENCTFKNFDLGTHFIASHIYSNVTFKGCIFEDIVADSIIYHNASIKPDDSIKFLDCKFINCAVNGIIDFAGDIDIEDYCAIEDCTYDFDAVIGVVSAEEYAHNYLNATKLKPVPADTFVDISSTEKGVVVIALTDNSSAPIAGATVKYTVNGGEEQTDVTGEDGKFTITGLTGEVTIAVSYEGNESFNPISGSQFFNFTEEPAPSNDTNGTNDTPAAPTKVATKLTAPKVTATYNVAKKLVITLKDANGKALANKKVTVKVGTISKTLKTNSKGQVSVAVNTLVPKTYTATIKFAGDNDYKASSLSAKVTVKKAAPKLTATKKTFKVKAKTKKVTATLKNNKGKVLKSTKLTLKIGKKTYTAKTNKKGVATFKVKLTKKGTYTGTVKFAGNKYFKAASKKVKIVVKK